MQTIHYFAGANTAGGFCSRFENIAPSRRRMFFIKGGPGVGKSSLMKRVGAAAEEKGLRVEYFHCSSDPDSLDGVSVPEKGVALMDGTAPHVYDPSVPGARDTLLALGDYLDEQALRPHARDIEQVQKRISERFARCYRYLAAAREVLHAAPRPQEDVQRVRQLSESWAHTLPLRGGQGSIRQLLGSSFTPRGYMTVTDFEDMDRCVTLDCPFGAHATQLMRTVSHMAAERGLDAVELLNPLCPEEIDHVLVPAHGVAFCTGARTRDSRGEWVDADALFKETEADAEQRFDVNAFELLRQRAVEQLATAKTLHDELEAFYIRNMDFLGWQKALDRVLEEL